MFCEQCGKAVTAGARFCETCGAGIEAPLVSAHAPRTRSLLPYLVTVFLALCIAYPFTQLSYPLEGTWRSDYGTYTFKSDGTGTSDFSDFRWKISHKARRDAPGEIELYFSAGLDRNRNKGGSYEWEAEEKS